MALVNCPECGRENVSDTANSCPSCGFPLKEHFEKLRAEEAKRRETEAEAEVETEAEKEKAETVECEIWQFETVQKESEDFSVQPSVQQKEEDDRQHQTEVVEKAKNDISRYTILSVVFGVVFVGGLALLVASWRAPDDSPLSGILPLFLILAVVGFGLLATMLANKKTAEQNLEAATKSLKDYDELQSKRQKAEQARITAEFEREAAMHPPCPMCGSKKTGRISTAGRAVSVAAVGLASSKIGKQYECRNCGHKW